MQYGSVNVRGGGGEGDYMRRIFQGATKDKSSLLWRYA